MCAALLAPGRSREYPAIVERQGLSANPYRKVFTDSRLGVQFKKIYTPDSRKAFRFTPNMNFLRRSVQTKPIYLISNGEAVSLGCIQIRHQRIGSRPHKIIPILSPGS